MILERIRAILTQARRYTVNRVAGSDPDLGHLARSSLHAAIAD